MCREGEKEQMLMHLKFIGVERESNPAENETIMAAHLTTGKVNLGLLRDSYRREFIECLDRCPGTKVSP